MGINGQEKGWGGGGGAKGTHREVVEANRILRLTEEVLADERAAEMVRAASEHQGIGQQYRDPVISVREHRLRRRWGFRTHRLRVIGDGGVLGIRADGRGRREDGKG